MKSALPTQPKACVLLSWLIDSGRNPWWVSAYAWNPLVSLVGASNGHVDLLGAFRHVGRRIFAPRSRRTITSRSPVRLNHPVGADREPKSPGNGPFRPKYAEPAVRIHLAPPPSPVFRILRPVRQNSPRLRPHLRDARHRRQPLSGGSCARRGQSLCWQVRRFHPYPRHDSIDSTTSLAEMLGTDRA